MSSNLHHCKGCEVQISKKKNFCKRCQRAKQKYQERVNTGEYIPKEWEEKWGNNRTNPQYSHAPKSNPSRENSVSKGKFVCDVCGKQHIGGNIAKGAQKAVGGTVMGIFGTLTMLTGGLTAPLMLGAAGIGAALYGSAEHYSTCSECRDNST